MPATEIRKEARESLSGKWGKAVCIVLAYILFTFLLGLVEGIFENSGFIFLLIEIAVIIISVPLSFGLIISFMKLKRGEDVKAFGFLKDGFTRFGKSWGIWWHTFIRLLLPVFCFILIAILFVGMQIFNTAAALAGDSISTSTSLILNIVFLVIEITAIVYLVSRSLLYVIAYHIGYDNPGLSSKECVKKSEKLMKGNRGNYFLLQLSFIGWSILACLTLGIGMLWLLPYMAVAEMCFYDRLAKPEAKVIEEEVKIEE